MLKLKKRTKQREGGSTFCRCFWLYKTPVGTYNRIISKPATGVEIISACINVKKMHHHNRQSKHNTQQVINNLRGHATI